MRGPGRWSRTLRPLGRTWALLKMRKELWRVLGRGGTWPDLGVHKQPLGVAAV